MSFPNELEFYHDLNPLEIPSFADAAELAAFEATLAPNVRAVYEQRDTDTIYRWDGTQGVEFGVGGAVPSCIELVGTALATTVALEVNSGLEVATLSDGNIISTGFFNVALDPNTFGVAGTLIDPAEGATVDVYLVGFPATAVTLK